MTADELETLRTMRTSKIRRNYWLCEAQLETCREVHMNGSTRLDGAAEKLQEWQNSYLSELVRRGERI